MNPLSVAQRAIGGGLLTLCILLGLWGSRVEYLRAGYKSDLAAERSGRALDASRAETAKTAAELRWSQRGTEAANSYADRLATRDPIILRSTDTVRTYAQTDAGRAVCLGADRVRGIDALDRDLADDPAPADRGAGGVPVYPGPAPAGR